MTNRLLARLDDAYGLPEHEAAVVSAVRELVRDKIAPRAEEFDRTAEFPWDNLKALNQLELNRIYVPEAFGGIELSFSCYLRVLEELSRGCPSTAIIWSTTFHAISPLIRFGTPHQKTRYLTCIASGGIAALAITEDVGGSDARAMRTTLRPDGEDVVINGRKLFITNGDVADVCLVFGKWSTIDDGRNAVSAIVVDKGAAGMTVVRKEDKMGHRASSTVELLFEDCRVPKENLVGSPGDGFSILLAALNRSRPSIGAHALGIARTAFEETVAHVGRRHLFGQKVADFQGVQFMIADMTTKLALAECWLRYVGELIDGGEQEFDIEASVLKVVASDAAMDIATNAVQLHGGYGYMTGSRVERLFRDAKVTQIWEGANELHRARIGRAIREHDAVER